MGGSLAALPAMYICRDKGLDSHPHRHALQHRAPPLLCPGCCTFVSWMLHFRHSHDSHSPAYALTTMGGSLGGPLPLPERCTDRAPPEVTTSSMV